MPSRNRRSTSIFQHKNVLSALGAMTVIVLILGVVYLAFGETSDPALDSVTLVWVLFRHGDRTPTDTYPTDPYKAPSFWPEGSGALTTKGKKEMFSLGVYLRRRYSKFLPDLYSPDDLYVVSSDHDRCLMSASLFLAGLYPPKGWQLWNEKIDWQPIPVHTSPRQLDQLIVVKKPCPKYDKELSDIQHSSTLTPEETALFDELSIHTGKPIENILDAELLYNTLEIEENRGLKLPLWADSSYPQPLHDIAISSLKLFTETTIMKRLKGGPLLKDVTSKMAEKIARILRPDRRIYIYSGHDLTIVSFLRALGVEKSLKPEPSAAVVIELHKPKDGGPHHVKVLYKSNDAATNLLQLVVPGCPYPCHFKTFMEVTKEYIPDDWDAECLLN